MVLREHNDLLNQSRGIISPLENQVQNNRGRLRQRFDMIRKLGQGTYGKVQLGIDKETGQEVAIKTIKKSKIETEADLIRIRREIQIMSSVQHPNIIHIYEVFENREKMVLVMEYAAGGELYDYLNERKVLQDDEARRIFRQIASAVYYCHKHKITHRDLKLENILLDENANAKIADFGLSNVFDDVHLLKTFCGSPLYASPEIVKGTPYFGPEVDCWSLGVLLYTISYGAMPFDGSNFKRLVKQISNGDYYEPKKPAESSELIRIMLTVDPRKRATIKDVCSHDWVNRGYDVLCLKIAEELVHQTPVRLDLLLSLVPQDISQSQIVIESPSSNQIPGKATSTGEEAAAPSSSSNNNKQVNNEPVPTTSKEQQQQPTVSTAKRKDAPLKPKRKVITQPSASASKSRKSKSSPVLELILDVEVEDEELPACPENDEQKEDDTLSEISEIQTIAEDSAILPKEKENNKTKIIENKTKKEKPNLKDEKETEVKDSKKSNKIIKEIKTEEENVAAPNKEQSIEQQKSSKIKNKELSPSKDSSIISTNTTTENKEKCKTAEQPVSKNLEQEQQKQLIIAPAPSTEVATKEKSPAKVVKKKVVRPKVKEEATTEKRESPEEKPPKINEIFEKSPKEARAEEDLVCPPLESENVPSQEISNNTEAKKDKTTQSTKEKPPLPKVVDDDSSPRMSSSPSAPSSPAIQSGSEGKTSPLAKQAAAGRAALTKRSDSIGSDIRSDKSSSPTRIERRSSKVISQKTAELIQNLETKTTNNVSIPPEGPTKAPPPKKLVFSSFKVSDAKRAFEQKPPKSSATPSSATAAAGKKVGLVKQSSISSSNKTSETSSENENEPSNNKVKQPVTAEETGINTTLIKENNIINNNKAQKVPEETAVAVNNELNVTNKSIKPVAEKKSPISSPKTKPKTQKESKEKEPSPQTLSSPKLKIKLKSKSPEPPKKEQTGEKANNLNEAEKNKEESSTESKKIESNKDENVSATIQLVQVQPTPKSKQNPPLLTKLKMPVPQEVKAVKVDNGTGTPKSVMMLVSGKTTPPTKYSPPQSASLPENKSNVFTESEENNHQLPQAASVATATVQVHGNKGPTAEALSHLVMSKSKEEAVKKICSAINKAVPTSSSNESGLSTGGRNSPLTTSTPIRSEIEKFITGSASADGGKMIKTAVTFPVSAPSSGTSTPKRERIIPIKLTEEDDGDDENSIVSVPATAPPKLGLVPRFPSSVNLKKKIFVDPINPPFSPSMSMTSAASTPTPSAVPMTPPTFSRQNSSDTESIGGPPRKSEPIRKSPREFIIPIKMETSGQTVTPKEELINSCSTASAGISSSPEDNFRMDRLRSGRFGRQKNRRYSSLLSDTSLEEPLSVSLSGSSTCSRRSSPVTTPGTTGMVPTHSRSHSQGDEPAEPLGIFNKEHRNKLKKSGNIGGNSLEKSDSFSSAEEEDEEDAFECLTAESLFSSLLDRVRNLTKRLNRDESGAATWQNANDAFWGTSSPMREFMSRAPSETRTGPYAMNMNHSFNREPSVTVTVTARPGWSRRSLSRELSGDSDSVYSDTALGGGTRGKFPSRRIDSFDNTAPSSSSVRSMPIGQNTRTNSSVSSLTNDSNYPGISRRQSSSYFNPNDSSSSIYSNPSAINSTASSTSSFRRPFSSSDPPPPFRRATSYFNPSGSLVGDGGSSSSPHSTPGMATPGSIGRSYGRTLSNTDFSTNITLPFHRRSLNEREPRRATSSIPEHLQSTSPTPPGDSYGYRARILEPSSTSYMPTSSYMPTTTSTTTSTLPGSSRYSRSMSRPPPDYSNYNNTTTNFTLPASSLTNSLNGYGYGVGSSSSNYFPYNNYPGSNASSSGGEFKGVGGGNSLRSSNSLSKDSNIPSSANNMIGVNDFDTATTTDSMSIISGDSGKSEPMSESSRIINNIQEKMNNYQNYYRNLSASPLRTEKTPTPTRRPFYNKAATMELPTHSNFIRGREPSVERPIRPTTMYEPNTTKDFDLKSEPDNNSYKSHSESSYKIGQSYLNDKSLERVRQVPTMDNNAQNFNSSNATDTVPKITPKWPGLSFATRTHRPVSISGIGIGADALKNKREFENDKLTYLPPPPRVISPPPSRVVSPPPRVVSPPPQLLPKVPKYNANAEKIEKEIKAKEKELLITNLPISINSSNNNNNNNNNTNNMGESKFLPNALQTSSSYSGLPKFKREGRALSVERITRVLERKSVPKETALKQSVDNETNEPIIIAKDAASKISQQTLQTINKPMSNIEPKDNVNNQIVSKPVKSLNAPEKSQSTSKIVSTGPPKISKPKFLQNLEKKWEKLTTSGSNKSNTNGLATIELENKSNIIQAKDEITLPSNSKGNNNTNPSSILQDEIIPSPSTPVVKSKILQKEDSPEVIHPSESMLLKRAVSPERKNPSKLSSSSTVGFMLGKFKKFEENTSSTLPTTKIPSGKPPVGRKFYKGATSDSVLVYGPETQKIKKPSFFQSTVASPNSNKTNPVVETNKLNMESINGVKNDQLNDAIIIEDKTNNNPIKTKIPMIKSNNAIPEEQSDEDSSLKNNLKTKIEIKPKEVEEKEVIEPMQMVNNSKISRFSRSQSEKPNLTRRPLSLGLFSENSKLDQNVGNCNNNEFLASNNNNNTKNAKNSTNSKNLYSNNVPLINVVNTPSSSSEHNEKDYTEKTSPTSPVSDSFDSSSVCSEKTEHSIRSGSVLDEEESVSDRIFRKSFYPRFNSLERKKNSLTSPSVNRRFNMSNSSGIGSSNQFQLQSSSTVASNNSSSSAATDSHSHSASATSPIRSINKYNPNPLFKELITDDFKSDIGKKTEYSRRVTSKLSKLLREIETDMNYNNNSSDKSSSHNSHSHHHFRESSVGPIMNRATPQRSSIGKNVNHNKNHFKIDTDNGSSEKEKGEFSRANSNISNSESTDFIK